VREIFTHGTVGGAPGNRCFYPELSTICGGSDVGRRENKDTEE